MFMYNKEFEWLKMDRLAHPNFALLWSYDESALQLPATRNVWYFLDQICGI